MRITVEFQDINGDWFEAELDGLNAKVVQHEVDHLNGVLITDRAK